MGHGGSGGRGGRVRSSSSADEFERVGFGTFGTVDRLVAESHCGFVAYFFHVIEQEDGSWLCRRGREDFGCFDVLDDAIEHAIEFASKHTPSEVAVHHLDGRFYTVDTLD